MEAKDLMIGDWVRISDDDTDEYFDAQIKGVDFLDNVYAPIPGEEKPCPFSIDCVEPIPLTPEILEKNGFYFGNTASEEDFCGAVGCGYPDSGWCFDEGAGEIKIIFPNETDGGLIRLDDQSGDRHLELVFVEPIMVHELQHCLKLVGIDKEINL